MTDYKEIDYKKILEDYDKKFKNKIKYAMAATIVSSGLLMGLVIWKPDPVTETRKVEIQRLEKAIDDCFDKQDFIDESVRKSLKQCYLEQKTK